MCQKGRRYKTNIKTDRLSEKSKTTLSQYDRLRKEGGIMKAKIQHEIQEYCSLLKLNAISDHFEEAISSATDYVSASASSHGSRCRGTACKRVLKNTT